MGFNALFDWWAYIDLDGLESLAFSRPLVLGLHFLYNYLRPSFYFEIDINYSFIVSLETKSFLLL